MSNPIDEAVNSLVERAGDKLEWNQTTEDGTQWDAYVGGVRFIIDDYAGAFYLNIEEADPAAKPFQADVFDTMEEAQAAAERIWREYPKKDSGPSPEDFA